MTHLNSKIFLKSLLVVSLFNLSISHANPDGITAFENKDLKAAKNLFETSLQQNPKDITSLNYLANIALKEAQYDNAEDFITQAQKLAPDNAKIQFDAGLIMSAQAQDSSIFSAPGYAKKSLNAFKLAVQIEPTNIKYHQGLMSFYLQAPSIVGGDIDLAKQEAQSIMELDAAKGYIAMAKIYQVTDEEMLIQHFKQLDNKYADNAAVLFNRAMYYQTKENFELAIKDFQKILTIKPIDEKDNIQYASLYQLGRTSVLSNQNIDEGIKSLQSFIDKFDSLANDDGLPSKAWAKYRLGLLYVYQGDKKTAKALYQQAKNETKDESLLDNIKKSMKKV